MKPFRYSRIYSRHERNAMAAHLWARRKYKRAIGIYTEWGFTDAQVQRLEAVCKIQSN